MSWAGAETGMDRFAKLGAADDLLPGTVLANGPVPVWYGVHLLAAAGAGTVLVISSRREAAARPPDDSVRAPGHRAHRLPVLPLGRPDRSFVVGDFARLADERGGGGRFYWGTAVLWRRRGPSSGAWAVGTGQEGCRRRGC